MPANEQIDGEEIKVGDKLKLYVAKVNKTNYGADIVLSRTNSGIVGKLFELTTPDKAYFGEKDFQQLAIIRHLVATKSYPIEIIGCPIVREESGLALSSRNALLSESEKQIATNIYKTLLKSIDYQNEKSIKETIDWVITTINNIGGLCVEYFEIVDGKTLQSIQNWDDANYIVGCITVFCGTVRLIDNIQYK